MGIDLGTTNSCVAFVDEDTGAPFVIELPPKARKTMPSVVAYGDDGTVYVGEAALNRPLSFHSVKRFIGRKVEVDKARKAARKRGEDAAAAAAGLVPQGIAPDSAQLVWGDAAAAQVPYDVLVEEESGELVLANASDPRGYTPPAEASALVLRALLDAAEEALQEREDAQAAAAGATPDQIVVTRAVVGVPAYFDRAQRAATVEAAHLAGIELKAEMEAALVSMDDVMSSNRVTMAMSAMAPFGIGMIMLAYGVRRTLRALRITTDSAARAKEARGRVRARLRAAEVALGALRERKPPLAPADAARLGVLTLAVHRLYGEVARAAALGLVESQEEWAALREDIAMLADPNADVEVRLDCARRIGRLYACARTG